MLTSLWTIVGILITLTLTSRILLPRYIPWLLSRLIHRRISSNVSRVCGVRLSIGDTLRVDWEWPWLWFRTSGNEGDLVSTPSAQRGWKRPIAIHLVRPTLKIVLPSVAELRHEKEDADRNAPTDYAYHYRSFAPPSSMNDSAAPAAAAAAACAGLSVGASEDISGLLCNSLIWRILRWLLTCIEIHITHCSISLDDGVRCLELCLDGLHYDGSRYRPDGSLGTMSLQELNHTNRKDPTLGFNLGWLDLCLRTETILLRWKWCEGDDTLYDRQPCTLFTLNPVTLRVQLPLAGPSVPTKQSLTYAIRSAIGRSRLSLRSEGIRLNIHPSDILEIQSLFAILKAAHKTREERLRVLLNRTPTSIHHVVGGGGVSSSSSQQSDFPSSSSTLPNLHSPFRFDTTESSLSMFERLLRDSAFMPEQIELLFETSSATISMWPRSRTNMTTPLDRIRTLSGRHQQRSESPLATSSSSTTTSASSQDPKSFRFEIGRIQIDGVKDVTRMIERARRNERIAAAAAASNSNTGPNITSPSSPTLNANSILPPCFDLSVRIDTNRIVQRTYDSSASSSSSSSSHHGDGDGDISILHLSSLRLDSHIDMAVLQDAFQSQPFAATILANEKRTRETYNSDGVYSHHHHHHHRHHSRHLSSPTSSLLQSFPLVSPDTPFVTVGLTFGSPCSLTLTPSLSTIIDFVLSIKPLPDLLQDSFWPGVNGVFGRPATSVEADRSIDVPPVVPIASAIQHSSQFPSFWSLYQRWSFFQLIHFELELPLGSISFLSDHEEEIFMIKIEQFKLHLPIKPTSSNTLDQRTDNDDDNNERQQQQQQQQSTMEDESTKQQANLSQTYTPPSLLTSHLSFETLLVSCSSPLNPTLSSPLLSIDSFSSTFHAGCMKVDRPPMLDLGRRRSTMLDRNNFAHSRRRTSFARETSLPKRRSMAMGGSATLVGAAGTSATGGGSSSPEELTLDLSHRVTANSIYIGYVDWLNEVIQHIEETYLKPFPYLLAKIETRPSDLHSSMMTPSPTSSQSSTSSSTSGYSRSPSPTPSDHQLSMFERTPFLSIDARLELVVPVIAVCLLAPHREVRLFDSSNGDDPHVDESTLPHFSPLSPTCASAFADSFHLLTIRIVDLALTPTFVWTRALDQLPPVFGIRNGSIDGAFVKTKHVASFKQAREMIELLTQYSQPSQPGPVVPAMVEIGRIMVDRQVRAQKPTAGIQLVRIQRLGTSTKVDVDHITVCWDTVQHATILFLETSIEQLERMIDRMKRQYGGAPPPTPKRIRPSPSAAPPLPPHAQPRLAFAKVAHLHPHQQTIVTSADAERRDPTAMIIEEDDDDLLDTDRARLGGSGAKASRHVDNGDDDSSSSSSSSDGDPIDPSFHMGGSTTGTSMVGASKSRLMVPHGSKSMRLIKVSPDPAPEDELRQVEEEEVNEEDDENDGDESDDEDENERDEFGRYSHSRISHSRASGSPSLAPEKLPSTTVESLHLDHGDDPLSHRVSSESSSSETSEDDGYSDIDDVGDSTEDTFDISVGPIAVEVSFIAFIEKHVAGHMMNLPQPYVMTIFVSDGSYSTTPFTSPPDVHLPNCPYDLHGHFGVGSLRFGRREILHFTEICFGGSFKGPSGEPDVALLMRHGHFNLPLECEFGEQVECMLQRWKALKHMKKILFAGLTPKPVVRETVHYPFPKAIDFDASSIWISAPGFIFSIDDQPESVRERHERYESLSEKQKSEEHILRQRFGHEEEGKKTSPDDLTTLMDHSAVQAKRTPTRPSLSLKGQPLRASPRASPRASVSRTGVVVEEEVDGDDLDDAFDADGEPNHAPTPIRGSLFQTPLRRMTPNMRSPASAGSMRGSSKSFSIPSTIGLFGSPTVAVQSQPQRYSVFTSPSRRSSALMSGGTPHRLPTGSLISPSPSRRSSAINIGGGGGGGDGSNHHARMTSGLFDVRERGNGTNNENVHDAIKSEEAPSLYTPMNIIVDPPDVISSPSPSFTLLLSRCGAGDAGAWLNSCSSILTSSLDSDFDPKSLPDSESSWDTLFHLSLDLSINLLFIPEFQDPWTIRQRVRSLDEPSDERIPYHWKRPEEEQTNTNTNKRKPSVYSFESINSPASSSSSSSSSSVTPDPLDADEKPQGYFAELWGRELVVHGTRVLFRLRDYPVPLISTPELLLSGTVIAAEMNCPEPFIKHKMIQLNGGVIREESSDEAAAAGGVGSDSSSPVTGVVTIDLPVKSRVPLKLFHDLALDLRRPHLTYGPSILRPLDEVSDAVDRLTAPRDPNDQTPKIPWWDKLRYLVHGVFRVKMNEMAVRLLTNVQPYIPSFIHITASMAELTFDKGSLKASMTNLEFTCVIHESEWNPIACGLHFLPGMPNPVLWRQYAQGRLVYMPHFELDMTFTWVCHGARAHASAAQQARCRAAESHQQCLQQHGPHVHTIQPNLPHTTPKATTLDTVDEGTHHDGGAATAASNSLPSTDPVSSHYVHHEWMVHHAKPMVQHSPTNRRKVFFAEKSDSRATTTTTTSSSSSSLPMSKVLEPKSIHTVFDKFLAQNLDLKVSIGINPPNYPCAFCPSTNGAPASTTTASDDPTHPDTLRIIPYITARWWAVCWIQDMALLYSNPPPWLVPPKGPLDKSFGNILNTVQLSVVVHAVRVEILKQDVAQSGGMSHMNGMKGISGLLVCMGHFAIDASFMAESDAVGERTLKLQEPAIDILQASAHILLPLSHEHGNRARDEDVTVDSNPAHIAGIIPELNDTTESKEALLRRLSAMEIGQRRMRRGDDIVNFLDSHGHFLSPFDKCMDGKVAVFLCSLRLLAFRAHYASSLGPCANPWQEPTAEEAAALSQTASLLTKELPFTMPLRLPPRETKWEEWFNDLVQQFEEDTNTSIEPLNTATMKPVTSHTNSDPNGSAGVGVSVGGVGVSTSVKSTPLRNVSKALDRMGLKAEDLKLEGFTNGIGITTTTAAAQPTNTTPRVARSHSIANTPSSNNKTNGINANGLHATPVRSRGASMQVSSVSSFGSGAAAVSASRRVKSPSVISLSPSSKHDSGSDRRFDHIVSVRSAAEVRQLLFDSSPSPQPTAHRPTRSPSITRTHANGRIDQRGLPTSLHGSPSPPTRFEVNVIPPSPPLDPSAGCILASPVGRLPSLKRMPSLGATETTNDNFASIYGVTRGRARPASKVLDYNLCSFRNLVVNLKVLWSPAIKNAVRGLTMTIEAPHPSAAYRHQLSMAQDPNETDMHAECMKDIDDDIGGNDEDVVHPLLFGSQSPIRHMRHASNSMLLTPNGSLSVNTSAGVSPGIATPLTPHSPMMAPHTPMGHAMAMGAGIGKGIAYPYRMSYDMDQLIREVDLNGTIDADDRVDSDSAGVDGGIDGLSGGGSSSGLRRAPTRREKTNEWSILFELDCIRPQINFQNPSNTSRIILSAARARLESHGLPALFDIEHHLFQQQHTNDSNLNQSGSFSGFPCTTPGYNPNSLSQPVQFPMHSMQHHMQTRHSLSQTLNTSDPLPPPMVQPSVHRRMSSHGSLSLIASPLQATHRLSAGGSSGSFNIGPAAINLAQNAGGVSPIAGRHAATSQPPIHRLRSSTSVDMSLPPRLTLEEILAPLYFEKKTFTSLQSAQCFVVPPGVDVGGNLTWVGDSLISGVEDGGRQSPTTTTGGSYSKTITPQTSMEQAHNPSINNSTLPNQLPTSIPAKSSTPMPSPLPTPSSSPAPSPSQLVARSTNGRETLLRRIVQPTTLHYSKCAQEDIDVELLRRGLGVLDDLNGIVAWQSEVKGFQRHRIRASNRKSETTAPNSPQTNTAAKTNASAHRSSLFNAASSNVIVSEPFATDSTDEKRVLKDTIQLFLPVLEAHMDPFEFATLISVVQSVLLALEDTEKHVEPDATTIPPTSTKQDVLSLQTIIEGVLDAENHTSEESGGSSSQSKGDVNGGLSRRLSIANMKKPPPPLTHKPTSAAPPLANSTTSTTSVGVTNHTASNGGTVVKSRVQYFLGQVSWEMLKTGKGFIRQSLTGMFGDHVFFADESVGIHAQLQHISLKSCLLPPGEKQHYHHLVRPDPVLWHARDTKRDMMLHIRALIREPLGARNPLLHYVTAYEHFEVTFFPLVVCLPHDHALMLRDYFFNETDEAGSNGGGGNTGGGKKHDRHDDTEHATTVSKRDKAIVVPSIKYFKYLRLNAIDFTFSFKHETRSIFTFENVHLLVSPYTKSKYQYIKGWSELFASIEKHVFYNVISHGTEIIAQKMGFGGGPNRTLDVTRALLNSRIVGEEDPTLLLTDADTTTFGGGGGGGVIGHGALPPSFSSTSGSPGFKKKEMSLGKKLLGIFSRGIHGKSAEEEEHKLMRENERRERERIEYEQQQLHYQQQYQQYQQQHYQQPGTMLLSSTPSQPPHSQQQSHPPHLHPHQALTHSPHLRASEALRSKPVSPASGLFTAAGGAAAATHNAHTSPGSTNGVSNGANASAPSSPPNHTLPSSSSFSRSILSLVSGVGGGPKNPTLLMAPWTHDPRPPSPLSPAGSLKIPTTRTRAQSGGGRKSIDGRSAALQQRAGSSILQANGPSTSTPRIHSPPTPNTLPPPFHFPPSAASSSMTLGAGAGAGAPSAAHHLPNSTSAPGPRGLERRRSLTLSH